MKTSEPVRSTREKISGYINLAKPRTLPPHLITATAAMFLAAGAVPAAHILWLTLLGGSLSAASANILNSYLDRDIDKVMERTRRRPLPSGLIGPGAALIYGAVIGLAGVSILAVFINAAAALLAAGAIAYYLLTYTLLLKRRTYWSTIIGSLTGAIPPLIGWVAVDGKLVLTPFLLAAIIIVWTVPHFWALALFRRDEYARVGIKVLPDKGVTAGIWIGSLLLVALSVVLAEAADLGLVYLIIACLGGAVFLFLALAVGLQGTRKQDIQFYVYTIFYIAGLYAAMIIDRLI